MAQFLGDLRPDFLIPLLRFGLGNLQLERQPFDVRLAMRHSGHDRAFRAQHALVAQVGVGMPLPVEADAVPVGDAVALAAEFSVGHFFRDE